MASNICIHSALGSELESPDLGRFYKRNGHKGRIQKADHYIWLTLDTEIAAAARLSTIPMKPSSELEEILILRGLWVGKQHREQGVGSFLLEHICTKQIQSEGNLYCFAYTEVIPFYQKHGFKIATDTAPSYLIQKQKDYSSRGSETELMVYSR